MRHRQRIVAEGDWHGEFGDYDEWARLGPQPPYRSATFFDAQGRRCVTQHDFARARDELPITLKQAVQLQRETDGRGRRRLA